MKFIKIEDTVKEYLKAGFNSGDKVVALLPNGELRHGELYFVKDYYTMFEVQLVVSHADFKTVDLCDALVCRIEL